MATEWASVSTFAGRITDQIGIYSKYVLSLFGYPNKLGCSDRITPSIEIQDKPKRH